MVTLQNLAPSENLAPPAPLKNTPSPPQVPSQLLKSSPQRDFFQTLPPFTRGCILCCHKAIVMVGHIVFIMHVCMCVYTLLTSLVESNAEQFNKRYSLQDNILIALNEFNTSILKYQQSKQRNE